MGANGESEIKSYISKLTGVPTASLYLCGLEQLEVWLKRFPGVATLANLDLVDSPLIISPDDLSEVVQAFVTMMADSKEKLECIADYCQLNLNRDILREELVRNCRL